ncbi:hypothetical protein CEXT_95521 [Caerostris extrusa]|uniref:EGF-like domain-containing protein n=1 Tax=Caerostris extrusa TaxID=172846 RepID=A0AAV4MIG9_CAEEX|nr:hypothetical protein CEXT_95521 [Caerostris extrusa]
MSIESGNCLSKTLIIQSVQHLLKLSAPFNAGILMQKGLLVAEMGLKIKLAVVFVVAAFFTVATSENELLDKKGFAANFDIDTIERGCDCGENSADCYLDLNGVQMCNCTSGYAQLNDSCSECDCGRRSRGCHFDADGNKVCECKRGYFQRFEKCEECDCGGGSTSCRFDQYGVKICNCSSLFAQRNGTCTETCFSDRHCKGRAVCRMGEGGAANFCECPPNYEGEDCEINSLCNRIKPSCYSRGATCEIIDSTAFCRCKPEAAPDLATGLCLCKWKIYLSSGIVLF